ncbi:hypothetical protein ALC57_02594 [Trachymyrmex cornetzi]|uniref:ABC transporter domain-containing protein n=1 Tax=Trachymyrmex cornetzi TaxID=471704 RepID=A0A151JND5_9HYME|nr:hypothetical protein ALC57_02594 [Trachymyrmex cornetzi]
MRFFDTNASGRVLNRFSKDTVDGILITQSINLIRWFQWGMRQSAEMENHMTSVERILEYSKIDTEPPLKSVPDKKPKSEWPQEGQIEFKNTFLRYAPLEPPLLKNLSFIGLHDLRSKINIISREPFLFSDSLRQNLDPFDSFTDEPLWRALEEVELKEMSLEVHINESGSNLSIGHRQLVGMAPAIVRNNPTLVLDEATANVEPQTNELIQTTIRKKIREVYSANDCSSTQHCYGQRSYLVMDAARTNSVKMLADHSEIMTETLERAMAPLMTIGEFFNLGMLEYPVGQLRTYIPCLTLVVLPRTLDVTARTFREFWVAPQEIFRFDNEKFLTPVGGKFFESSGSYVESSG